MRLAQFELHLAVFLFGISGLFGKLGAASPATIVIGRTAFAAVAIFAGLKFFQVSLSLDSNKTIVKLAASGLILALHWVSFFHAIQISTVAIGLIGFSTFPIFVTFLEPLVTRQKLRRIDLISATLVFVGLVLVAPSFDLTDSGTLGLLWAVFSGALFAVLTLLNRHLVSSTSFLVVAFYQHSSASIFLLPFVIWQGQVPEQQALLLLLILGVFCTALPQTLFIKSLASIKAQLASIVTGLEPVYGIIFAAILLHEFPGLRTLIGAGIVFFAVIIAMRAHSITGGPAEQDRNKQC